MTWTPTIIRTLSRALPLCAALLPLGAHAQTHADEVALWNASWAQYQSLESVPLAARGYVSRSQDLTVVIEAPVERVFRFYSNVDNALGLHPFLKAVIPIRFEESRGTPIYDFIADEDIPLADGTLFHGVTVAQQRLHPREHDYDVDSYDVPGVVTHQHVTFRRVPGGTEVTEHLVFEAPLQYIDQTVQGGVYAHTVVQAGLKAKIESEWHKRPCDDDAAG